MEIQRFEIIPQRLTEKNLIICQRSFNWRELNQRIAEHVQPFEDETTVQENEIYAFRVIATGETWGRAMFRHYDGDTPVLHRLDGRGVFNFDTNMH